MSYRVLALPNRTTISLPVLRKLREFVAAGATVVGPAPTTASGRHDFADRDAEVKRIAAELWGRGGVIADRGVPRCSSPAACRRTSSLRTGARREARRDSPQCRRRGNLFRLRTGSIASSARRRPSASRVARRSSGIPSRASGVSPPAMSNATVAPRCRWSSRRAARGSWCSALPRPRIPTTSGENVARFAPLARSPVHGRCVSIRAGEDRDGRVSRARELADAERPGNQILLGTATYTKAFDRPAHAGRCFLELGRVREVAEVRVNGKSCGSSGLRRFAWRSPTRETREQPARNRGREFLADRVIGDAALPPAQRLTKPTSSS